MLLVTPNHWDIRFFNLCQFLADWSEDRGRKVGAVIVGQHNEIRSTGFNGFPRRVSADVSKRHDRELGEKYHWVEHAERNAIYNAARVGVPIEGCRIYASHFPCAECVRAIIQSGITEINTSSAAGDDPYFKRSFEVAKEMISETGVELRLFSVDSLRSAKN
jgi:dCMP deaminase